VAVDGDAGALGPDGVPQRFGPARVDGGVLGGVQPDCDDGNDVALLAVGECGGARGDAGHSPAPAAEMDQVEDELGHDADVATAAPNLPKG